MVLAPSRLFVHEFTRWRSSRKGFFRLSGNNGNVYTEVRKDGKRVYLTFASSSLHAFGGLYCHFLLEGVDSSMIGPRKRKHNVCSYLLLLLCLDLGFIAFFRMFHDDAHGMHHEGISLNCCSTLNYAHAPVTIRDCCCKHPLHFEWSCIFLSCACSVTNPVERRQALQQQAWHSRQQLSFNLVRTVTMSQDPGQ